MMLQTKCKAHTDRKRAGADLAMSVLLPLINCGHDAVFSLHQAHQSAFEHFFAAWTYIVHDTAPAVLMTTL
jgi:hypothetical protein